MWRTACTGVFMGSRTMRNRPDSKVTRSESLLYTFRANGGAPAGRWCWRLASCVAPVRSSSATALEPPLRECSPTPARCASSRGWRVYASAYFASTRRGRTGLVWRRTQSSAASSRATHSRPEPTGSPTQGCRRSLKLSTGYGCSAYPLGTAPLAISLPRSTGCQTR